MDQPSSEVVGPYVAAQVAVIVGRRDDVDANAPDAVHVTRVACRRLRSTLRTFRALWPGSHRKVLRELRWYGQLLGAPRDTEVLEEALLALVDELDATGKDALADRLRERLEADRDAGLALLREELRGERFALLVEQVRRLSDDEDWDELAAVPSGRLLPALAYGPVLQVSLHAAHLPQGGPERLVELHEVRKKAKRARYAYEASGALLADEAALWKKVTETLGGVQDGHVGMELVEELRREAENAGEPTAAYDALTARLQDQVRTDERDGLAAIERAIAEAP